ncbi:LysR family transcriptional regulator [Kordiimonas aquimaris]|uniref:LysR family transcriptional regulator n=1 Tax=Kordiimonas aquimaris TaxID=707591 RepID=UPI0021D0DD27|nr:LysR family transcriptional regulator [Kordiimonas aquimaris]
MNNLSNMQLFVKVVEEGSFSATARYFGIMPSSVSRQISHLENELGARLFHRTTRKQSLTEAGQIYYQHTLRIVADIEEAKRAVSQLAESPSGHLHVTVETDFAVTFIAPVLPEFFIRYPKVQVRFSMNTDNLDIVDNAMDLAIRFGHLGDSGLIARKLAMSSSVICASPDYLATYGTPSHPSQLGKHNCLSFRTAAGKNYWKFNDQGKTLDIPISGSLNANNLTFLKENALTGQGIIMIPSWMVHSALKEKLLIPLLEDFPLLPSATPIHAVFAHNRHLAPKVRAFVDFLAEKLK